MLRCHTEGAELEFEGSPLASLSVRLQRFLSGQETSGHSVTPSLPLGTAPTLGPFEGGYKWLLLACGPVWGG